ncbi:MAG: hypothetical protein WA459_24785 [Stellaceae bacterium]
MAANRKRSATVDIKIRMKEPLRAEIERSAREKGISMNAEMTEQLGRIYEQPDLLVEAALESVYGPKVAGIVSTMAHQFARNGWITALIDAEGDSRAARRGAWLASPVAYDLAVRAANFVMEQFRPSGDPSRPGTFATKESRQRHAEWRAASDLAAIRDPRWSEQFPPDARNWESEHAAEQARRLLTPDLVSRIPDRGSAQDIMEQTLGREANPR